jgi:hypothetical protein
MCMTSCMGSAMGQAPSQPCLGRVPCHLDCNATFLYLPRGALPCIYGPSSHYYKRACRTGGLPACLNQFISSLPKNGLSFSWLAEELQIGRWRVVSIDVRSLLPRVLVQAALPRFCVIPWLFLRTRLSPVMWILWYVQVSGE